MVATTNQDKTCEPGEGRRGSCEAGDRREGVLGEECEDGGSEVTTAVKTNNTDL